MILLINEDTDQKIGHNTAAKNAANNEQLRTACRRMCAYNFPVSFAALLDLTLWLYLVKLMENRIHLYITDFLDSEEVCDIY